MRQTDPRLTALMELSPFEFERAVTQLITSLGFRAQQTQASRDGGIDIWGEDARPFGSGCIIVQCKRYANDNLVGEPIVRELFGLVHAHGVNTGVLLTTSGFTADARRFAAGKPIELIDGTQLLDLLRSTGKNTPTTSAHRPEPSLLTFSNSSATMEEIADWSVRKPKPFALRICMTLPDFWDFFWSNWGPPGAKLTELLFLLDYHAAAYHLLEDATFRFSPDSPVLRSLFEQRVGKVAALVGEHLRIANQTVLCEADEYLTTHIENRDGALLLCQGDVQPLCIRYWWKSTSSFMLPELRPR